MQGDTGAQGCTGTYAITHCDPRTHIYIITHTQSHTCTESHSYTHEHLTRVHAHSHIHTHWYTNSHMHLHAQVHTDTETDARCHGSGILPSHILQGEMSTHHSALLSILGPSFGSDPSYFMAFPAKSLFLKAIVRNFLASNHCVTLDYPLNLSVLQFADL